MASPDANSFFPLSRWTRIRQIQQGNGKAAEEATAGLCHDYWHPLYAFARRQARQPSDAQDLTQGFFEMVLEKNLFRAANPEMGRLRTFLLTAFQRYMGDVRDRETAKKRGGGAKIFSLDVDEAENRLNVDLADTLTPELEYDRSWALAVLRVVHARFSDHEQSAGRGRQFEILGPFLSLDGTAGANYAGAAKCLGVSEEAVRQSVSRMRKRFGVCLREQIADTLSDPTREQVDEELQTLRSALAREPR